MLLLYLMIISFKVSVRKVSNVKHVPGIADII